MPKFVVNKLIAGSRASYYFDALRWISAFYVLIFHLRPVLFKGFSNLENQTLFIKIIYTITSLGFEFVLLFFVLSGFLISSSVIRSIQEGTWSWKTYLTNRLTRLWIVLIPALILTNLWAQFQLTNYPDSYFFNDNMKITDFLGNMFFLQGVFVDNYGGNLALWSLANEFWYYILFPCIVLTFKSKRLPQKIMYGSIVIVSGIVLGKEIMMFFLVWLLGTLLVILPSPPISRNILLRGMLPLNMICLAVSLFIGKYFAGNANDPFAQRFSAEFLVSLCFASLLYIILHSVNQRAEAINSRRFNIHVFLAGFSYTLYLTHYPLINFIRVWLGDGTWGVWNPDLKHFLLSLMVTAMILGYALVVAYLTEMRTDKVRRWVGQLLGRPGKKLNLKAQVYKG
ncbi:acyltransferase family protein [Paenibacillus hamazuiensis]|uniref:acyltransferase family protein n=1 Tax=Paenibacillus hamazuiensis TaxID=2936508 RepID=UPI00200BF154|nr:acyltransferase [Paenibacillus hamazuiensis]